MKTETGNEIQRVQRIAPYQYYIHFNVENGLTKPSMFEGCSDVVYNQADTVMVYTLDRAEIIAAIIRFKYSQNAVEAIVNNYLSGENSGEYQELQRWRKAAKSIADGQLFTKQEIDLFLANETVAGIGEAVSEIIQILDNNNLLPSV